MPCCLREGRVSLSAQVHSTCVQEAAWSAAVHLLLSHRPLGLSSLNLSFILLSLKRFLCLLTTCSCPKVEASTGSFLCHRVLQHILLPADSALAGPCRLQWRIRPTSSHACEARIMAHPSCSLPGGHVSSRTTGWGQIL